MRTITRQMNHQFSLDAEAALAKVEKHINPSNTFEEWARLLKRRAERLLELHKVLAPSSVLEKEMELIEQALEGCHREFHHRAVTD